MLGGRGKSKSMLPKLPVGHLRHRHHRAGVQSISGQETFGGQDPEGVDVVHALGLAAAVRTGHPSVS